MTSIRLSIAILVGQAICWPQTAIDFKRDIEPIFTNRCRGCHGDKVHMGEFRLDRRSDAMRGGGSGVPAIVPGKSTESLLVRYISGLDAKLVMPPAGPKLTAQQIQLIRDWVDQGAVWPETGQSEVAQTQSDGKDHWSFQPISRKAPPIVKNKAWVRNPIDAFILAKLETRGWQPAKKPEGYQLLRRFYLDVIGLPPTISEQDAFLANPTDESLDRVVDDLLSRPGYGERWGRHWLDLVRYADTNAYERDAAKPNVWRYRDYVIRSLNQDKPYNRFIAEQVAGDELPDANAETLIATGFNRLGAWDDEPADPETDRYDQLDDIVSTTSQAFLGLTLGCARCHNHKFDPLTARDYYSMVAIFNGLERPRNGRTELDRPVGTRPELEREAARDAKIAPLTKQIEEIRKTFRASFLASGKGALPSEVVEAFRLEPGKRSDAQKTLVGKHAKSLDEEIARATPKEVEDSIHHIEAQIKALKDETPDLPRAYFMNEPKLPGVSHLLIRGNARALGPEVTPAVPAVLTKSQPVVPPPAGTSLRRLTLANWLTDSNNPLTARVIVNRVWQAHFGEALVRTPSDFGRIGEKPTHPELLDWLANWFVDNDWSLKKLHRLIMTSNTYRMSKGSVSAYAAADPENRLFWRFPYTRLQVEPIRDSMLQVAGNLNSNMYGPPMYPFVPKQALEGSSDPDKIWKPFDEKDASRRTIYAFVKRSMIVPMLDVLDFCDTARSSAKRINTSVAPQALTLFNGDFVNRQARHLAERLKREAGPKPEQQIEYAYRLLFAHRPSAKEVSKSIEFLRSEGADDKALEQLCRVLLNMNEFVYTD